MRHAQITSAYGVHPIIGVEVADQAARLALTVLPNTAPGKTGTPLAVGHVVRQLDMNSLWVLRVLPATDPNNWSEWGSSLLPPFNVAGTLLTLDNTYLNVNVRTTAATAVMLTVPQDFTAMSVGQAIQGIQIGLGKMQLLKGGVSVVLNGVGLYTRTRGSPWTIYKAAANEYDFTGDLVAS